MTAIAYFGRRNMNEYLRDSKYIDFGVPAVKKTALGLAAGCSSENELVRRCFQFVRDEIQHSWDFKRNPVTRRASDVLAHGTGYCYAKSHLLAALLRANGVPAGLCYQRLSVGESGAPYCLHGLNAVFLQGFGWYRIDARGNKPGVHAEFSPPVERLSFRIKDPQERDLPEVWAEPLPVVIEVLEAYDDVEMVSRNLPDVALVD